MSGWGPLNARARGLTGRLLDRAALERLARAEPADLAAGIGSAATDPAGIERAARRQAGALLAVLGRWAGDRRDALAVLFDEEDLRSVRRLLRGAAAGAPPERRLAGLVPTPTLGERALADAAEADTPAEALARLARAGHPDAASLRGRAGGLTPDLFRLEVELARGAAARMVRATRRSPRLAAHVRRSIDLANAGAALAASGWAAEVDPAEVFVAGGEAIDAAAFAAIAALPDAAGRRRALAGVFAGGPLAGPFADLSIPARALEAAALGARIEEERRARRVDPLGPAPFLELALRIRAQVRDVGALAWGAALGAADAAATAGLATP